MVKDEEGYLYFICRKDEMIKTSGYRVSPTEVEEVAHAAGGTSQVAALGLPHAALGQAILLLLTPAGDAHGDDMVENVLTHCRAELPNFMVPLKAIAQPTRSPPPKNSLGKRPPPAKTRPIRPPSGSKSKPFGKKPSTNSNPSLRMREAATLKLRI